MDYSLKDSVPNLQAGTTVVPLNGHFQPEMIQYTVDQWILLLCFHHHASFATKEVTWLAVIL